MPFSRRKFLSLPLAQRHRKAAEALRRAYLKETNLSAYHPLCLWLELPLLEEATPQRLSDRYHLHLQLGERSLREERLLPRVRTQDRQVGALPLAVDVYLDHIRSAHNVGSIVRTVEAFRLGTLYLSEQTPDLNHRQVRAASMGAWEHVKWFPAPSVESFHRPLIALETAESAVPLRDFCFPQRCTLALGNEEYGCSAEALAAADLIVEIPLYGCKNSLNVANSFAIVAAAVRRQL